MILYKGELYESSKHEELELSYMFRNIWIKKLPHDHIVKSLHKYKDHLQTVVLFVSDYEQEKISNLLINAGITKISKLDNQLSEINEAHDGEYPLRRYSKIVER